MKIFLDTADLVEIKRAHAMGVLDGVTTNPSLVARTGKGFRQCIEEICEVVSGPISVEVTALDAEGMVAQGRAFTEVAENVVVKLPLTEAGVVATRTLSDEGVRINNTLCFSPLQALLSAKAGATYVSPFIGRLDDIAHNGMELIGDIRMIYDNYGYVTQILAASIRHPMHVVEAARLGADVVTIPFSTFEKLIKHPLTDRGLEAFLADWEKVPDKEM